MYQSHLFGPTRREAPREEESKNAILLSRGGYVYKTMSGVYAFLPLGWRVIQNLARIVREEMLTLPRAQEILMPALQPLDIWRESGRIEDIREVMYRLEKEDVGLGPTHEETITDIFRHSVHSYRDLPVSVFQIQTKYRQEPRAKSGLLRGREFLMKDLYSFHVSEEDLAEYYEIVKEAYFRVFQRCGLQAVLTEASGGVFSKYSHEFQVVSEAGEDEIFLNAAGDYARNKEIVPDENAADLREFSGGQVRKVRSIEVGNIFKLNKKFSTPLQALVQTEKGDRVEVWTASYGIGISRLMGALVEARGEIGTGPARMLWPREVAPFPVHLIDLTPDRQGEELYHKLQAGRDSRGGKVEVLYDDRTLGAGEKFADADLIGAPVRLIISKRSLEQGGVELIDWIDDRKEVVTVEDFQKMIVAG
jgi:prolyl-tRNA synthetase